MKHKWAAKVGIKLGLMVLAYLGMLIWVWFRQEKLIFKPDPFSKLGQGVRAARAARSHGRKVKEWKHLAGDGVVIQGFISEPPQSKGQPRQAVIYFGGIREESSWTLAHAHEFGDRAFVCLNYRGYGMSGGTPSEERILSDALAAVRELEAQGRIQKGQALLIGRSLGSGVAGYVCERLQAKKVCLVTPYDSVLAIAKKQYWYLPVGKLLRHRFEATQWAQTNKIPMLMILAQTDETVPHENSQRLFAAWAGQKEQIMLSGCDHRSIAQHPELFKSISSFFEEGEPALAKTENPEQDGSRQV